MNQLLVMSPASEPSCLSKPAHDSAREARSRSAPVRCRACASDGLLTIIDLGCMPLANALLTIEQLKEPEPRYPLVLAFCPPCGLVQITETVPADVLYRHYVYFSSYSETMVRESRRIAERMIGSHGLNGHSCVIEIASNDGYLLQFYKQAGVPALGIEPASNVAARALERGISTVCGFFSFELAQSLRSEGKQADVIHANNVLGHVADIDGFFRALASLLKNDGVIVIEVPYVRDMIEHTEFDTVYHEHLSYFSLAALDRICLQHGLVITNVERLAIHGGSLRVFAEHGAAGTRAEPIVSRMLAEEASCGLTTFPFYIGFSTQVACLKGRLLGRLTNLKSQGARIAVYGASAKGATLLNHFGIDSALVDFVVDRNPSKQGLYTPGTHLPVYPVHKLLEEMPEYVLLLTWNFAEEIIEQQAEYRRRGGHFIVPIPDLRVI